MRAAENHPHSRVTRRAHPLDQGAAMKPVVEAEFDVSKGGHGAERLANRDKTQGVLIGILPATVVAPTRASVACPATTRPRVLKSHR